MTRQGAMLRQRKLEAPTGEVQEHDRWNDGNE
jgi:hypothetical protein